MPDIQGDINVIVEESIEYSKDVKSPGAFKIFDAANKVLEYSNNKLTLDYPQSVRDMRDLLWRLGHIVSDSTPTSVESIEIKKDIVNKISGAGRKLERMFTTLPTKGSSNYKRFGARRMIATVKSGNYGETIIERAEAMIRSQKRK